MTVRRLVVSAAVVALGIFAIVAGGIDDSPGAQLIGVVLVLGAVALGVRRARHPRH